MQFWGKSRDSLDPLIPRTALEKCRNVREGSCWRSDSYSAYAMPVCHSRRIYRIMPRALRRTQLVLLTSKTITEEPVIISSYLLCRSKGLPPRGIFSVLRFFSIFRVFSFTVFAFSVFKFFAFAVFRFIEFSVFRSLGLNASFLFHNIPTYGLIRVCLT